MNWIWNAPRRTLALIFVVCAAMIGFGLYLQHVVGLEPCPMCIVQRYCIIAVGVLALLGSLKPSTAGWWKSFAWLAILVAAKAGCSGTRPSSPPAGEISTA